MSAVRGAVMATTACCVREPRELPSSLTTLTTLFYSVTRSQPCATRALLSGPTIERHQGGVDTYEDHSAEKHNARSAVRI